MKVSRRKRLFKRRRTFIQIVAWTLRKRRHKIYANVMKHNALFAKLKGVK